MEFPEAILFDLDGVILDTEPILSEAWVNFKNIIKFVSG